MTKKVQSLLEKTFSKARVRKDLEDDFQIPTSSGYLPKKYNHSIFCAYQPDSIEGNEFNTIVKVDGYTFMVNSVDLEFL